MTIIEIDGEQYNLEGEVRLWEQWLNVKREDSGENRIEELKVQYDAEPEILAEVKKCYEDKDVLQGRVLAERLFYAYGSRYNRFSNL